MTAFNQNPKLTVRLISLGCSKNLVDTEVMAGYLQKGPFRIVGSDTPSDIALINTCGFIGEAKKESIETLSELIAEKQAGRLSLILVAGCLSQRYVKELPKLFPDIDAFIGVCDYSRLSSIIFEKLNGKRKRNYIRDPVELINATTPRAPSTPIFSRYVKLSEGCSHGCSFCTIPLMRGALKSRTIPDILQEIQQGIQRGTKEFNLIAQDLNEYGRDLGDRSSLFRLFSRLREIDGDIWIRPLYMYPLQFPDRLIREMADHPHVLPYVDIPLQHIEDSILKSMRRGSTARYIHRLIKNLRNSIPTIVLRTTFIVGYPGETPEAFNRLLDFIQEIEFDRLGVFTYSEEEGTHAATLTKKIPETIKLQRRDQLMKVQQKISLNKNKTYVGKKLKVLYEGLNPEIKEHVGRFYGQAPEIDGQVLIRLKPKGLRSKPKPGDFISVRVKEALEYDLVGVLKD